ncbi:hypothetical protein E2542_SST14523 [Spatholobus suberectus]|nr:hypothetical protein E2542_SST14523 [Spatholobus suberectus]
MVVLQSVSTVTFEKMVLRFGDWGYDGLVIHVAYDPIQQSFVSLAIARLTPPTSSSRSTLVRYSYMHAMIPLPPYLVLPKPLFCARIVTGRSTTLRSLPFTNEGSSKTSLGALPCSNSYPLWGFEM